MNIRPIRTEADYDAALARVETLMDAEADTPEGEELDVLATLISAYEKEHYPIAAADPVAAIRHAMETRGYSQKDLGDLIGSPPRASEILSGAREVPKSAMWDLHTQWRIPAESLIRPKKVA
jgi:HTH-type transcriptional regulator / antitoxin HigA